MDIYQYLCIGLGALCVFLLIGFIAINHKYNKTLRGMKGREVDDVNIKGNVRYTINQTVLDEDGNATISLSTKDIVLSPDVTEVVGTKNRIKPGKYTILASNENETDFHIRIGKYVKTYTHNQNIVLSEGQEITAINNVVILR